MSKLNYVVLLVCLVILTYSSTVFMCQHRLGWAAVYAGFVALDFFQLLFRGRPGTTPSKRPWSAQAVRSAEYGMSEWWQLVALAKQ